MTNRISGSVGFEPLHFLHDQNEFAPFDAFYIPFLHLGCVKGSLPHSPEILVPSTVRSNLPIVPRNQFGLELHSFLQIVFHFICMPRVAYVIPPKYSTPKISTPNSWWPIEGDRYGVMPPVFTTNDTLYLHLGSWTSHFRFRIIDLLIKPSVRSSSASSLPFIPQYPNTHIRDTSLVLCNVFPLKLKVHTFRLLTE